MLNRIVTNGFGRSRGVAGRAGPITMGYGGFAQPTPPTPVVTGVPRRKGGSSTRPHHPSITEVTVWARMLEINGRSPPREISGTVRVKIDGDGPRIRAIVEHVGSRRSTRGMVTATRVKRRP